jgi:hypothetical protein
MGSRRTHESHDEESEGLWSCITQIEAKEAAHVGAEVPGENLKVLAHISR